MHTTAAATETIVSVNGTAVTELVPDANLASHRRRQRQVGRCVVRSVQAMRGYYVTTDVDPR
jgi:hypothetical protein